MGWGQDMLGIGLHGSAAPREGFLPPSRFEPLGHFIPELEDAITSAKYGTPPNESNNDGEPGLPEYYYPSADFDGIGIIEETEQEFFGLLDTLEARYAENES